MSVVAGSLKKKKRKKKKIKKKRCTVHKVRVMVERLAPIPVASRSMRIGKNE